MIAASLGPRRMEARSTAPCSAGSSASGSARTGAWFPRYLSWSRSAPAVPVLPRQGTGRPPGSRWMRLGEVVCQS